MEYFSSSHFLRAERKSEAPGYAYLSSMRGSAGFTGGSWSQLHGRPDRKPQPQTSDDQRRRLLLRNKCFICQLEEERIRFRQSWRFLRAFFACCERYTFFFCLRSLTAALFSPQVEKCIARMLCIIAWLLSLSLLHATKNFHSVGEMELASLSIQKRSGRLRLWWRPPSGRL